MDYKQKFFVGGGAVVVGVLARCFMPTPTINGADILAGWGCWLLWRGLITEWPKPAPPGGEEQADDESVSEERRRIFQRLFKEK